MACTTDNATNNDTLMSILETVCKSKNIEFTAYDNHVRCLAHVINLAAQAALSKLKVEYVELVLLTDQFSLAKSQTEPNSTRLEPMN